MSDEKDILQEWKSMQDSIKLMDMMEVYRAERRSFKRKECS